MKLDMNRLGKALDDVAIQMNCLLSMKEQNNATREAFEKLAFMQMEIILAIYKED